MYDLDPIKKEAETRDVVSLVARMSTLDNRLVGNTLYLNRRLRTNLPGAQSLPCDYFLGAHGSFLSKMGDQDAQRKAGCRDSFYRSGWLTKLCDRKGVRFRKDLARAKGGHDAPHDPA